jgi:predicted metal-dependent HD superfamily phosphohydrolase
VPSYDECLVDAELKARADYAAPGRHYHDERHLDDCLWRLDQIHDLSETERRLLRWAILWHDSVYDPTRTDNEELSAERAFGELAGCGVAEETAAEVARLIGLTSGHRVEPGDRLGAILVSIDLSILGADPERYRSYAADVRREYAHVGDEAWQAGRAAVLKRLLEANPLYPEPSLGAELEEQARRNMEEELRSLAAG